ncbi:MULTISPECIES: lytic polysaccharide monooxygenase [Chromobacteriaceae]|uniref:Carbohydrate-binding protein n=1 Tax=Pseudogulbenkiania ferrooxidans EGD-HP2 TaxID=1388764 RepID=A0ABP2XQ20_9NEIS|nr:MULTISPECIES: lytic polysaccharide monooxygenase [Chromobacteriaceae]AVG14954.1 chitin-binding protein [Chromobacterium vaccinii]ERE17440.1 carbohydrate-binding protein [Pseudogulbenkiania ferrooxidans EGD-HP2]
MKLHWHLPAALTLSCLSAPLWAHGAMEIPINRVYSCFLEGPEAPKSSACQAAKQVGGTQAMYDWNGVNQNPQGDNHQAVVPDGTLCGGGKAEFKGFNLARDDWRATSIVPDASGNFEFIYKATAPHATKYFKFYVTRNGWNPKQALKWSDLELFGTVNGNPTQDASKRYHMTLKLPQGKTGPHIIFNVWKRSDSEEAFYSCSDVNFGGDTAPPAANPWKEIGNVAARENLPAGSSATLRVFDSQGRDAEKHTVALNAVSGQIANWPYELAQKVNAASPLIRIGVMKSQQRAVSIVPVKDATANRVYLNDSYKGYGFAIDLKKGDAGAQPPAANAWKEGDKYAQSQVVSYQGRQYRCLQSHTAWAGAGWTPSTQPTLWQAI